MQAEHFFIGCAAAIVIISLSLLARRSVHTAGVIFIALACCTGLAYFAQAHVAPFTLGLLLQPRGKASWWLVMALPMVIALYLYERARKRKTPAADSDEDEVWYWLMVPLLEVLLGAFLLPVIISPLVSWLAPDARGLPEWVGDERGRVNFFLAGMVVNGMIAIIALPLRGPFQMAFIVYVGLSTFGMVFNFGVPVALVLVVGTHLALKILLRRNDAPHSGFVTS